MSNQQETDVQDFLQRIAWSFLSGLIWLFINMTAGIFGGWLFFEHSPTLGNIIFYAWMLLSLAFLLRILYKTWNRKFPHG
jgi:membrane protein DedA with SNARE-associated domain